MNLFTTTFESPFGLFSAAVDDDGSLVATAFGSLDALRARVRRDWHVTMTASADRTARVREQLLAYFRAERHEFELPLRAIGTEFQRRVWAELVEIPCGETRSYADLANRLGSAPRAVGRANAMNPLCVVVPCHRVIGKTGELTGFAFGTALKQQLLRHERQMATASAA
jgi:methylated-DNA-[protein]-cysteine S-methyltransferase